MDNNEKRDVYTHVHSQDEQYDSQSTKPDMHKDCVRSGFSTYCEVSADIRYHFPDDYQIVQNIIYEDDQEEDNKCHREGDSGGVSEMMCLQSVKIEDEVQQSNDQKSIEPFNYSTQISTAIIGVNKFVDVKHESTLDIGVRSSNNEETRHWIVCSGNVLKEVKAEYALSKPVTECSEDFYEKHQQWKIHNNNTQETETNVSVNNIYASALSLTQSSQLETGEDVNTFDCDTCGTSFTMSGSLQVDTSCHRRVKTYTGHVCTALRASQCERNVPEKILTSVKHFDCSTCGKSFARVGSLNDHESKHYVVKPFTCTICGNSFARMGHLREHERIHSGVKPFACTLCGKSFMRVGHLSRHERIHAGVKPRIICTVCGKSFSLEGNLRSHERMHAGVKPFTCTHCGKSFAWARNLTEHERIHSGVKPFHCTICGKSFSRAGKLREHEINKSGVKPFTCTLCGKSFTTMGNQRRHERILCSGIHVQLEESH